MLSCRKVEQLSEEVDSLKETLDKHSFRQRKRILEAKERAELFERAVSSPWSKARTILLLQDNFIVPLMNWKLLFQNGESSHVLQIFDDEAQARQSAHTSSRMLDEAYETGVAILHKYSDQRDRLKVNIVWLPLHSSYSSCALQITKFSSLYC